MNHQEDDSDLNRMINSLSIFVDIVSLHTQLMVKRTNFIVDRFVENFETIDLFDALGCKLSKNKLLKFIICLSALSCAIPVVLFAIYAIISLVVTFTGFLFIEGTLLAAGAFAMFMCTAVIILVLTVFAVASVALYLVSSKLSFTVKRLNKNPNTMRNIVSGFIQSRDPDSVDNIRAAVAEFYGY